MMPSKRRAHRPFRSRLFVMMPTRHPIMTRPHTRTVAGACGLHFMEAVRRQVMEQFGAEDVLKGGLRIYTTVDLTLQKHAEAAIAARLAAIDKTGRLEGRARGARSAHR